MIELIGLAFVGGVILNVMPCVLPVVTLKVFHTIETLGDEREDPRLHGLAYAAGTTLAFLLFASAIVALRASGHTLGWGMHFRHPPFVAALVALIFAFGLNALGVFEINLSWQGGGQGRGLLASVGNGLFAAIMSTPCTAPFLVTAAGFAMAADTSAWQTGLLFGVIGFGLAFPYVLISFIPGLARMLPKPGTWMVTFKHLMGFTLLGTAVWLYGALQAQITPQAANWFLAFLLVLAVALWAAQRFATPAQALLRRIIVRSGLAAGVIVCGVAMLDFERNTVVAAKVDGGAEDGALHQPEPVVKDGQINWVAFAPEAVVAAHHAGRPVFMDYTADWCAACKTNERLFIETEAVRGAFVESGVLPMKVDMTNENETMDAWLEKLGRSGIPAYAIYLPDGSVDLLPITITTDTVVDGLRRAAAKYPPASARTP